MDDMREIDLISFQIVLREMIANQWVILKGTSKLCFYPWNDLFLYQLLLNHEIIYRLL